MKRRARINTEVIIIGAGPTGLMAACQLARYGIDFVILDTKSKPTSESRALLITARSLEIYDQMGISQKVVQQGKSIQTFSIFTKGRKQVNFAIGNAGRGLTDFPYMQVFEQSKNEELLYDVLKRQNQEVWWDTEFISLEQNHENVTVQLNRLSPEKESITLNGKYLIACDGAGSKVRHQLKCKFEGGTYENKFFIADTRILWDQPEKQVVAGLSRLNFCAFFPMYGDHNYRVLGTLPKSFEKQEKIAFDEIRAVIESTIEVPLNFDGVNWFSTYRLHYRCTDRFRAGRCFLAGDAAHIHSPAGGQGMNTGLQDAYNLSWKLALVLQGFAGDRLLETYHTERYPFAKWLLKFTDSMFGFMTSSNVFVSIFRTHLAPFFIRRVLNTNTAQSRVFRIFSQIWYAYTKSPLSVMNIKVKLRFKAGDRFPYILTSLEGKMQSCYQLLKDPGFHLVVIEEETSLEECDHIPQKLKAVIRLVRLPLSQEWRALGVKEKLYILVRPDNYIGLLTETLNENTLQEYLTEVN